MRKIFIHLLVTLTLVTTLHAKELHVATNGIDTNPGTRSLPLRTIQRGAELAKPGDVITVHEGVYRERINPPEGGTSDKRRIVYRSAPGEKVGIKGSEVIKNWVMVQDDTWKVVLPNSLFGAFNPYSDLIHGDWFHPISREHHTGAVYLNGEWLMEAPKMDDVLKPIGKNAFWFGRVDKENTTIWAQFRGVNPNENHVEINVRKTIFYPAKQGINFITVRGFTMQHAATPWAPPTAEQIGLIGTHWSKGWIIENNVISHSRCSGIALGKHGDEFDNTSGNSAGGYVKTIERALKQGWDKKNIGHHIVRNNTISHCEQTGIVGSMGAVFSTITGNTIHDIHVQQLFAGAEMAGIKLHGAIDVEISKNHIYHCSLGLWLDWMAQGAQVTKNLFNDNGRDLFLEVNHGPYLIDNNIFLSAGRFDIQSDGGAFVHNLIAGNIIVRPDNRLTPIHKAHATTLAGLRKTPNGDVRFYNNLLAGTASLSGYDAATLPVQMEGNVFLKGAKPSKQESAPMVMTEFDPQIKVLEKPDGCYLELTTNKAWSGQKRKIVTSALLGKAVAPDLPFETRNGTQLRLNTDFIGKKRDEANPFPGPFEISEEGKQLFKVW
jgi:alpha-N-arabinofuranosidase